MEHVSVLDKVRAELRRRGEMTAQEIAALDDGNVEETRVWLLHHAKHTGIFVYDAGRGTWKLRDEARA